MTINLQKLMAILTCILIAACHSPSSTNESSNVSMTPEQIITQTTAIMRTTMTPLVSPDNNMKSLMEVHQKILTVPVIYDRAQLTGRTFVLGSADGDYVLDDLRLDAPSNGTRFILYGYGQEGLRDPLVENGYVDCSWTEEGDRVLITMIAVANGQTFLNVDGDGEKQFLDLPVFPVFAFGFPQIANIELAARRLSVDGVLNYLNRDINFNYERHSSYGDAHPGIVIHAMNEWHVELTSGSAHFFGDNRYIPNFDSDQSAFFEFITAGGNTVEFSITTLRGAFVQPWEVRVDGTLIDAIFVDRGSEFALTAGDAFRQVTSTHTNVQKLLAPAMYPLLAIQ